MKRQKKPVLVMDPFFVLPEKLVDACLKLLPVSNTVESALSVDDESSQTTRVDALTETIQIKDVGNFSRRQIEIFKRVINLKATVQQGIDMHKIPDLANDVAKEVLETYPYKRIAGLPDLHDFNFSMLYRATPPTWLSDAAIRACCLRLVSDYPSCRFAGFLSATPRKQRARNNEENTVNADTRDRILDLVGQGGVTTVFLPLNFSNAHWCCVVVKVDSKRIFYYDPLNQGPYMNAANAICTHLKISGLQDFDVIPQNSSTPTVAGYTSVGCSFGRLSLGGPST
ncbi:hypothetical protein V7S43_016002 [Phytophthora oleae]|uniref:Ubiquitin-like protease family profile domain-containing protein n=1 Tax=Phytophthora oleae TaxID=2107226 RepID=A0ABD3EXC1_9STRA